jgi:hypothetical protein
MDSYWIVLLVIIPVAAVCFAVFYLIRNFFENEAKKLRMEIKKNNTEVLTPIRLQAYERIVLLLERISPNSLVMRVYKNGMNARMMQAELIKNIRSEFEHNLSQQIYISVKAWELVKTSKEETIKLINIASTKVDEQASGMDMANAVIEIAGQLPKLPTQVAIEALKVELSTEF